MTAIDPTMGPGFAGLPERDQLKRAAHELESVLVEQLFSAMRKTVPKSGLVQESPASEIFRSMLDAELARSTAEKSPFGLADAIVQRFERALSGTAAAGVDPVIKRGHSATEAPKDGALPRPGWRRVA